MRCGWNNGENIKLKMNRPDVSVIMAVYKEPLKWIIESIESIVRQTFVNIEFIIIIDNNQYLKAIETAYGYAKKDMRIKIVINSSNLGLALSLNRALSICTGKYIARMDADDISFPERISIQKIFLDENKDISLVGSWVEKIDENGKTFGVMKLPSNFSILKKQIYCRTISFHPTWMVRKTVYDSLLGYRPFNISQDYDFLFRAIEFGFKVSNIQRPLLRYRISSENISYKKALYQIKTKSYIKKLSIERLKYNKDSFSTDSLVEFQKSGRLEQKFFSIANNFYLMSMKMKSKHNLLFLFPLLFSIFLSKWTRKNIYNLIGGTISGNLNYLYNEINSNKSSTTH